MACALETHIAKPLGTIELVQSNLISQRPHATTGDHKDTPPSQSSAEWGWLKKIRRRAVSGEWHCFHAWWLFISINKGTLCSHSCEPQRSRDEFSKHWLHTIACWDTKWKRNHLALMAQGLNNVKITVDMLSYKPRCTFWLIFNPHEAFREVQSVLTDKE